MKENNRIKKKHNSTNVFKRAFTLVELVVVIAIIAILSGVSVAGYFGYTSMARKSVAEAEASSILTQFNIWSVSDLQSSNDLFVQLDDFRDDLIADNVIQSDTSKNKSLNYYVDAASLESNYEVSMFYTASNGYVALYNLGANTTSLTGTIELVKADYGSLDAALKVAVGENVEVAKDVLQYKDGVVNYKQYAFFDIDGNSIYPEEDTNTLKKPAVAKTKEEIFTEIAASKDVTKIQEFVDAANISSHAELAAAFAPSGKVAEYKEEKLFVFSIEDMWTSPVKEFDILNGLKFIDRIFTIASEPGDHPEANKTYTYALANDGYHLLDWRVGSRWTAQSIVPSAPVQTVSLSNTTNGIVAQELGSTGSSKLQLISEDKGSLPLSNNYDFNSKLEGKVVAEAYPIIQNAQNINSAISALSGNSEKTELFILNSYFTTEDVETKLSQNIPSNIAVTFSTLDVTDNLNGMNYKGTAASPSTPKNNIVTVDKDIEVDGTLNVGADMYFRQPNSSIVGNNVELVLTNNAKIIINNGGTLNCFGKISGEGTIEVKDGGKVLEPIAISDWRGGGNATGTVAKNVFPFLKYDMSNISTPVIFESGSDYVMDTMVEMSSIPFPVTVNFIGDEGIFNITNGKLTKEIVDGKMNLTLSDGANFIDQNNPIVLSAATIDITKVAFPISNLNITVNDGCTATFSNLKLKLLPTSTININGTGKLIINEKATLAVYDEFNAYKDETLNTKLADYRYTDTRNLGTFGLNLASSSSLTVNGTLSGNVGGAGTIITGANATFTTQLPEGYQMGLKEPYIDTTAQQDPLVGTYNGTTLEAGKEYPAA